MNQLDQVENVVSAAASMPEFRAGRHRPRPRAGDGRRQGAHPGLPGRGDRPPGRRHARDLHRAQDLGRRRRRAHLPAPLARRSTSIEVVRRGKVRRAKLYYLRNLRGKAARIEERRDERRATRRPSGARGGSRKESRCPGRRPIGGCRRMLDLFAEAYRLRLLRGLEELLARLRLLPRSPASTRPGAARSPARWWPRR